MLNTRPNGVMQRKKYNPLAVIIFLLGLGILAAAIVKSRMTGLAEESFSMAATGIAVVIGSFLLQLIPNPIDQNPWAHWRSPMDMMRQG